MEKLFTLLAHRTETVPDSFTIINGDILKILSLSPSYWLTLILIKDGSHIKIIIDIYVLAKIRVESNLRINKGIPI